MTEKYNSEFGSFLDDVEQREFNTNKTATGAITIQQSQRNTLRKEGLAKFKADLEWLYGDRFDIVETKDGIVVVAENEPNGFTFSWEIKCTIKSINYDPFLEAQTYDDEEAEKAHKKALRDAEKLQREEELAAKRAKKLAELAAKTAK